MMGVNRARKYLPLLPKMTALSFEERREIVLSRECPERLRLSVVEDFVMREKRLPRSDGGAAFEDVALRYVNSALERRHESRASGEQLHHDEIAAWEVVFQGHDVEWLDDQTLVDAKAFYLSNHGKLNPKKYAWIHRKKGELSDEEERLKLQDVLAHKLDLVRRAKVGDVYSYFNHQDKRRFLLRRQLSSDAMLRWEAEFGDEWQWFCGREGDAYIPGERIEGERFEWSREPLRCKALGCFLCGEEVDTKRELIKHWRHDHMHLPKDSGP